ncbi:hypothetical protein DL96DRAFT_1703302 [Flagelloscypha sp. PMI_526]|nr:hypothetical protein DL96DRAFT_1703302 [Flagelloscypha sp. PMI_526]
MSLRLRTLKCSLRTCQHPRWSSTVVPGLPGGLPNTPVDNFLANVIIPSGAQPQPLPPIQIPFAPDFWESASEPKPSIPPAVDIDNRPKLVVVAGADSRPISATSQEVIEPEAPNVLPNLPKLGQGGLFDDIIEDFGVTVSDIKSNIPKIGKFW